MATVLTIVLEGNIYPEEYLYDSQGISKTRIQNQINAAGEIDEIVLMIDSWGGQMEEGWKIIDYLLSLGKPIKTIIVGCCYSMATALFLVGTERLISPNSEMMIHLPAFDPYDSYVGGNKFDLEEYIQDLLKAEEKALNWYVQRTGRDETALAELMAAGKGNGTYMSAEEAIANGFATGLYQSVEQIKNRQKSKAIFMMSKYGRPDQKEPAGSPQQSTPAILSNSQISKMSKTKLLAAAIMSVLGIADGSAKIKNMEVALENGTLITIDSTGDTPAIGDAVKQNGEPVPDGDYKTADGQTITVTDGVISDIKTTEGGELTSTEPVNTPTQEPAPATLSAEEFTNLRNEVARLQGVEREFNDFKARTVPVIQNMQKALGQKVSVEPVTTTNQVREPKQESDGTGERAEMLTNRKQKDWKKARTQAS
ncbi:Clp protease ClpP [Larkinella arboricola]